MADTNDLARAREALASRADKLDPTILGAVRDGLLSVPAETPDSRRHENAHADPTRLAIRRTPGR